MRRWQLTAVLFVLAGAGLTLAGGVPVGAAVISSLVWTVTPREVVEPTPVEPDVRPLHTRAEQPGTTIPELSDPTPAPIVETLPPDPAPVFYGCGGGGPSDQPRPACGMG